MNDPIDPALQDLQREYLGTMPTRLDELRSDLAEFRDGHPNAADSLKKRLHRLAGSGGSYGFLEVSSIAREAEHWLSGNPPPNDAEQLAAIVDRLAKAVSLADAHIVQAGTAQAAGPSPRALVLMRPTPVRDRIAQELRDAGYEVRFGTRQDDPATTPHAELPHLVVIGGEAGEGDPSAIASAWTRNPARRPGAVVLIETLRAVDRLRAIAAGVDAVFPAEQVEQKLPRYARTFARIGPPPSSVLLVEPDDSQPTGIVSALEAANIKVVRCQSGQSLQERLERERSDLLLLDTRVADPDPFTLIRLVRQDSRYTLLPVVVVGPESMANRIAALRAGADDFLLSEADPELQLQTVIARAARGRRVREMVHRDGLTGLLNHATLVSELENAVEYSRRHGEPLAFVLFELENFKRLGDRLGPRVSDEILLHVAAVFRANVRASDVIGRYGGDAFGMLLRGASATGITVLTDKLHRLLREHPARTTGGDVDLLPVNVGAAVFPRDGMAAAELVHAADRAVRAAGRRGSGAAGQ
ncbi:MAG: diguanylate cyclase [Gemmatimonadales bacterium]